MKRIIALFLFLPFFYTLFAQPWPQPELPDTSNYGSYTSSTLHLLQTSTPEKPKTVKILVYGQSISAQDYWLDLKKAIETRFPNADLINIRAPWKIYLAENQLSPKDLLSDDVHLNI